MHRRNWLLYAGILQIYHASIRQSLPLQVRASDMGPHGFTSTFSRTPAKHNCKTESSRSDKTTPAAHEASPPQTSSAEAETLVTSSSSNKSIQAAQPEALIVQVHKMPCGGKVTSCRDGKVLFTGMGYFVPLAANLTRHFIAFGVSASGKVRPLCSFIILIACKATPGGCIIIKLLRGRMATDSCACNSAPLCLSE